MFEYFHEGSWWVVQIKATSMDDAQVRLDKLPLAKPVGQLVARIPARYGWFLVPVWCWLKNLRAFR